MGDLLLFPGMDNAEPQNGCKAALARNLFINDTKEYYSKLKIHSKYMDSLAQQMVKRAIHKKIRERTRRIEYEQCGCTYEI